MANVLANISNIIIPLLIFYLVAYGLASKIDIYSTFIKGAENGFKTVIQIMPTLIGLMVAVGILRASGFLDFLGSMFSFMTDKVGLPSAMVPLMFVRMFSSSAATALILDMFKEFGTDSYVGMLTSVMMSCTETIFYTMSVYFMTAKVTKTRFTLPGALIATGAGMVASVIIVGLM